MTGTSAGGRGRIRVGLAVAVVAVVAGSACSVAGPRPGSRGPSGPEGPVDIPGVEAGVEPEVRVGVKVGVASLELDGTGRVAIVDAAGRARSSGAGPWTVTGTEGGLDLRAGGETVRVSGIVVARPASGQVRVDGKPYHGAILLRPATGGVTAVNVLDMERYLLGVVPLEIGAGRPAEELEAVKAQAIAARTYAVRHMGRREALGFDFYGSVNDQVYGGVSAEDPVSSRAVRETAGQIIAYDGRPIEAFYHSTCGGHTAALEEVWVGEPRPYLQSISDRNPRGGWFCESSNRFRWTEEWSEAELHATLTAGLRARGATGSVSRVESMDVTRRSRSGRAQRLVIQTNLGREEVFGDSIRRVLMPDPNRILNSTAVEIRTLRGGAVTGLVVEGAGWGHGIGMCQIGAVGRSRAGHSYRDILLAYYPGTTIVRLY